MSPLQLNKLLAHYSLLNDERKLAELEAENKAQMARNRQRWK